MSSQEKLIEMNIDTLDDIINNKLYVDGLYKIFLENKNNNNNTNSNKNKEMINKHINYNYKIFIQINPVDKNFYIYFIV